MSRRNLLSRLWSGIAALATAVGISALRRRVRPRRRVVCRADSVAVGTFRLFDHPGPEQPCILIRPAPDRFVAYARTCTHEGCAVGYRAGANRLECPCHGAAYAVEDGHVLQGPPPRGLVRFGVALEDGDVVVWETVS